MSNNSSSAHQEKISQAIADIAEKHAGKILKPGTPEWDAACNQAVEDFQLQQHREEFAKELERELPEGPIVCVRQGGDQKCTQGPVYGSSCVLCGKRNNKL